MSDARLNVRISEQTDTALEIACATRRVTKQAAVSAAIEAWLSPEAVDQQVHATPAERFSPKTQRYMERLGIILESGDESAAKAVSATVDVFSDRLRPNARKGQKSQRLAS